VSPEWVEKALECSPAIRSALVLGDGLPFLVAVIEPAKGGTHPGVDGRTEHVTEQEIEEEVGRINAALPRYARIRRWTRLRAPFSPESGTLTLTGKPIRSRIVELYSDLLGRDLCA
jgi:long-subunit acyl-CoA synthetase (AMP-forming)